MALEPVGIRAVIEGLNTYLSGTREMATSTARVGTAAGQVERATTQARGPLLAFGNAFSSVAKIAGGFVLAQGLLQLPGLFSRITGAASDLGESINAVQVIFGPASAKVLEFGKNAAESAGLSQRAFNELATPLGALLKNAGLSIEETGDRTIELTKRAADMASVFNTDVGDALGAIQAALRGETEPIRRFGISLNEAAISAEASALGLAKVSVNSDDVQRASLGVERAQAALNEAQKKFVPGALEVREAQQRVRDAQEKLTEARKGDAAELTQGMKLQAAYSLIMKQSADVQGDFANTADSAANRTRRLQARQENLRAELGAKFLPLQIKFLELQNAITSVIVNKVVPAIDSLGKALRPVGRIFNLAIGEIGAELDGLMAFLGGKEVAPEWTSSPLGQFANFAKGAAQTIIPVIGAITSQISALISMFSSGFSGATIGGQFSDIERAAFNLGQMISGLVGNFRDLAQGAGELFHLFKVGLTGGEIGGEFTAAQEAAFEFGKVVREDVIPTVQAMAAFSAALALEITKVVGRVAEFVQSSGLLESFGLGLLTLAQGFIKFVQIVADVIRPVYTFFRENDTARTILAVAAVIALLASGIGTIPVAVVAAVTAIGFLRKNFQEISDFINRYVLGTLQSLVDAYLYIPRQLLNVGSEIVSTIVGGIERASDAITNVPGQFVRWLKDGFVGWASALASIGSAIVDGVWKGIQDSKDYFLRKIGDFFGGAVDYVKDKLGIGSPSKEGEYIGEMFALGVQNGIQNGTKGVVKSGLAMSSALTDAIRTRRGGGVVDPRDEGDPINIEATRLLLQLDPSAYGDPNKVSGFRRTIDALISAIDKSTLNTKDSTAGFNKAIDTGASGATGSLASLNMAYDSGTKAITGTIGAFTTSAAKAITALSHMASQPIQGSPIVGTPGGTGGGTGGTAPAPQSYTRTIAAGYAYGKAPPAPPPSTPTTSAPAAPVIVTVNGPAIPGLAAITHAAVDSAFAKAQNQSVRQGALLPNGIG